MTEFNALGAASAVGMSAFEDGAPQRSDAKLNPVANDEERIPQWSLTTGGASSAGGLQNGTMIRARTKIQAMMRKTSLKAKVND